MHGERGVVDEVSQSRWQCVRCGCRPGDSVGHGVGVVDLPRDTESDE